MLAYATFCKTGSTSLQLTGLYLGCCLLVGYVVKNQQSAFVRVLELRPLVFIGKISYGLYVYHLVVPFRSIGGTFIPRLFWGGEYSFTLGYCLGTLAYFSAAIAMAYASWRFMERPILAWKRKFQ